MRKNAKSGKTRVQNICGKYSHMDVTERGAIICMLQMIILYNATIMGWKIKKIGNKSYELSKYLGENAEVFDVSQFLRNIVALHI